LKPPFFYQRCLLSVKAYQNWADIACCYEPASFPTGIKDAVHDEV
jgi:hypothetical protein